MNKETLKNIMPYATDANVNKFVEHLTAVMAIFNIDTPMRQAHFLAQLAHESGSLRYVREIASGEAYEGRKDLGNTLPGDGVKYKGRGLIQLTGRINYTMFDTFTFHEYDLLNHPERVEEPYLATLAAGWFWDKHKLNAYADQDNCLKITRIINGGTNGLEDRQNHLERAKKVLCV